MRLIVFVLSIGLIYGSAQIGSGQPASDSPAVVAAKQREKEVRSVAVEFRLTEEIVEGGISSDLPPMPGAKGAIVPPKASKLESTNRLVLAGNKTRYESNHPLWNGSGRLHQIRMINTADGSLDKSFHAIGLSKSEQPEGFIGRNAQSNDIKTATLVPLTVWFRGLQPSISSYHLDQFRPTTSVATIGGRECQIYSQGSNRADTTSLWCDPSSGYAIRRIRADRQGRPRTQYDIDYRQSEFGIWVPVSWVRNHYSLDGKLLASTRAEVTSTRINEDYPESAFNVDFPPGTRVYDARQRKDYIVREDGSMQEFSIETGELLPNVVHQPGASWFGQNYKWIIGSGFVLAISVAAFLLWRRNRV